jgi:hypothetical protein
MHFECSPRASRTSEPRQASASEYAAIHEKQQSILRVRAKIEDVKLNRILELEASNAEMHQKKRQLDADLQKREERIKGERHSPPAPSLLRYRTKSTKI